MKSTTYKMDTSQIRLRTDGFRAIASADIDINGITLVAGENGCGKSTLSKLLYHFYKTATVYEDIVARDVRSKLSEIVHFLEVIISEINRLSTDRNSRAEFYDFRHTVHRKKLSLDNESREMYIQIVYRIVNNFNTQLTLNQSTKISHRFGMIIENMLGSKIVKDNVDPIPVELLIERINEAFDTGLQELKARNTSTIINVLRNTFTDQLPEVFEVYEHGDQLMSLVSKNVGLPFEVQNVVYIDTPMMLNVEESNNTHWDDLDHLLAKKSTKPKTKLSTLISNDIINGEAESYDDDIYDRSFSYKRKDGEVFDLLDCATGIKAFSIIQLLLDNGTLNSKTLLIIDEPESNLHPQWIIEYARLIVLLNKEFGVKFFLASHNPDMVSALKHIAMKEGRDECLYFYLANRNIKDLQYTYQFLDKNIDPIFKSFNIALDRINHYSTK